ncbi:MAG: hypothetical protein QM784_40730 [Polyangiaceae bacterium]
MKSYAKALGAMQESAAAYCSSIQELGEASPDGQCVSALQAYFAADYEES